MTGPSMRVRPLWLATAAVAAVFVLYAPTFASMVAIWNRDSTFTHGYIIPLLSGWLLWRDRAVLAAQVIEPEYRVLWLIAALALLWLAADLIDVQVVRQAAATALIPATLWTVLGSRWARCAAFPLLYLFFAVPFGDFLVPSLVQFTTDFTVAAVRLVGVPIYRDGTSFSLPSGNFEVVKACSGVRYLIATIALGTLFAALSYRSWSRRLAFMALCVALPVVANGIRAFGIVMIAHYSQMKYAVGFDHLIYGWIFFGFVMLLLFWVGGKFIDAPVPESATQTAASPRAVAIYPLALSLLVLAIAPLAEVLLHRRSTALAQNETPIRLIDSSSVWRGPFELGKGWRPPFTNDGEVASGRYRSDWTDVNVFVRRYAWQSERTTEATTAPLVLDGKLEWRLDPAGYRTDGEHVVDVGEIVGINGERWRVWRWYLVNQQPARGVRHAKLLELRSWLRGAPPEATVVCIAVSMLDARSDDAREADGVLQEFARALEWRVAAAR